MKFALTLKFNCPANTTIAADKYDPVWELFKKYDIKLEHLNSEFDSKRRLHYHGIANIPSRFYRKKLCLSGFHTNLLPLNTRGDIDRWIAYCYKDVPPEDWPDLCDDPPVRIKPGIRSKLSNNIFKCCNDNKVTI